MTPSFPPHIDQLVLIRFLAEEASREEQQQVEAWAAEDSLHQRYLEEMALLWQSSASAKEFALIDVAQDWQKVKADMKAIKPEANLRKVPKKHQWTYSWLKIAAVAVLGLGLVFGYYSWQREYVFQRQQVTLATDQPIQLTLSDGTKVYLNRNARLTYPERFTGQTRAVTLTGEAFFEVAPNQEQPFLITSGAVVTRVVGTSFSVNASREDSVWVTVLTGKVALTASGQKDVPLTLTPGESGLYRRGVFTEAPNTDPNFMAWKTGILTFQNSPLPIVIRDLSKYYNQPFQLESKLLATCALTATFKQESLSEVLEEMQLILPIKIQREGNTILLTGEGCQ